MKTYEEAVEFLTSAGKYRISLGLERMQKIMALLGNPQDKIKCIHVAGTNGKGSVCSIIASILNVAGYHVGLYTSPHIFKYTERIKTNICSNSNICEICDISDDNFAKYVFKIANIAAANNIDLTEFEILTAVMFTYFADKKVDIAIIETGLGGRYDATNIIQNPICSIITHVDFDHTERLGNTIDKIAYEKAGIMKKNSTCIVLESKEIYYDTADKVGCLLNVISPVFQNPNLNLKGFNQQENLSLALAAIEKCFPDIDQDKINEGISCVKHPFRFQYIKEKKMIIDGAHNPNGIKSLVENLNYYYPDTKKRIIFGCLRNKDYHQMLNILYNNLVNQQDNKDNIEIYFYHFNHTNSATYDELKRACPFVCKELTSSKQINFNDEYLNIVCGSFYMISQLTQLLKIEYYFR